MGSNYSLLTDEELQDYKDLTYLTRKEILHVFKLFSKLNPEAIEKNKHARLPSELVIEHIPELKNNPFSDRLCDIFSSNKDAKLSFEDFLDMMSVLSESAPLDTKSEYAFRVYDFDGDGVISKDDMRELINRLTGGESLSEDEMTTLIDSIFAEVDLDDDGLLAYSEFQHVVMKSSRDFMSSFHVRL